MRPPSVSVRNTSSPDLKDLKDDDPNSTAGLTLWNRWATEDGSTVPQDDPDDLDATMEEEAIRFFELPVESTGGRRRRLLAQFCENTKHLDAWLRRVEPPAANPEPSDVSEQSSSSQRRPPYSRKWPRQMLIKGSVRKGFGIRKPRSHAELSEELHLSREEDDMMVQWESRWREQELEHQHLEEARARAAGVWCRTPSFGAEAASPSSEQDDFADEVRAICGDASLEFAAPEGKQRVTITLPCSPLLTMAEDEEDEIAKHEMSREERLMRFCPEVVNPAFSQEVKAVLQKSLVRGASKVLAEHRGHRLNCERFRRKAENEEFVIDDQRGLRLAMHLHARTQQHYRRGCPATPPLQGITLRAGSIARQSPDFRGLRQALPGKPAIIAANRKRKKPARQVQSLERGARESPSTSRSNSPRLFEPVLCSFECRNWRAASPLQVRLEQEEGVVLGSQWRDFLEELRLNRGHGRKPKAAASPISRKQTAQDLEMSDEEQLKSKESLESGKVQDCPDAHAYHLVRQGRLEALARWGGLEFVRPCMLRQLLFYVARNGSVRMLQLLLDEMCKNHPDALHWREAGAQGGGATLLHAAAEADMLTMCVLLEDLGADLEATDQNGKRPWEVAGPFCAETFNNYGSFRGDDRSPLGSTLRLTSTLQTISEKPMSRTTTRRLSHTQWLLKP